MKLNVQLHLVQRLKLVELHVYFPIRLHGVVLNKLSPEITFTYILVRDRCQVYTTFLDELNVYERQYTVSTL
jgi:hypothetical protein